MGSTHRYITTAGHLAKQFRKNKFLLSRNSPPADYCLARTVSSQVPPRLLPSNWHQPDRADLLEYNSTGHESSVITCSAWHHSGLDLPTGRGSVLFCLNDHGCGRLHNVPHDSLWGVNSFARRHLHTSYILRRDESKVEETLEAIKDKIKKDEQVKPSDAQAPDGSAASTGAITPVTPAVVAVKKKSLREKIVAEVKHYYHGFRLLFIDFRVCARLLWQVLNGKSLMRREQKQLVRTTADLFRLVPFLVFVIVPFAEFLLPVALKLFPGMLPSTFQEEDKEKEKLRKKLKMKLEMAKFLQDTIEETALQRQDATGESVHDFVGFMEKIRTSGVQTSNEEILKFSKLFEDEITLDNLSYQQLSALCKLLEVTTSVGPSYFLRFQLEMKLRQLEADDKMIQKEGIDSMAVWELQEACRQRGMRSFGVPEERLKLQLTQWLDLHLNHKIPASLLLLSRTLYLPETLSTEDQLKATLSTLPDAMAEEAKVKILEVSGDRVDNKSKLEIIKQEEEMIQQEKAELEKQHKEEEQKKAKAREAKAKLEAEAAAAPKMLPEQVAEQTPAAPSAETEIPDKEVLFDKATLIDAQALEKEEIHSKDLEQIEDILEHVADKQMEMKKQVEELEALKEDFIEYKENLGELQGVMEQSGGSVAGLKESKSAERLSRKVSKMIEQMDMAVKDLAAQKAALMDDIKAREGSVQQTSAQEKDETARKQILEQITEKRDNLITISDLILSIQKLQNISDSAKIEKIAKVLDADQDGIIDYSNAMEVIDLLSKENVKLNAEQLAEIMVLLKKEKELSEEEKKIKKQQQVLAAAAKKATENAAAESNKEAQKL